MPRMQLRLQLCYRSLRHVCVELRLHRLDLGVCVQAKRRQQINLLTKRLYFSLGPRNELLLLCTALHNAEGVSRCCGCDICMIGVHIWTMVHVRQRKAAAHVA